MKPRPTCGASFVLPGAALVLPPLAVFAPLGAAPLLAITALAILIFDKRRCWSGPGQFTPIIWLLAALGIWGAASALWSILPRHSLIEGFRFLFECVAGLAVTSAGLTASAKERRSIHIGLLIGIALAIFLLAIERFDDMPITHFLVSHGLERELSIKRFDRGITVLVLLLWPAGIALRRVWQQSVLIAVILIVAISLSSAAALLAALMSLVVFALAYRVPHFIAGAVILGIFAIGIGIPLATPSDHQVLALRQAAPWIKPSGIHRLLIWRFGAERVANKPYFGWGMDTSRGLPGGKTDLNKLLPTLHYGSPIEAMPLHPHNALLQLRLELGIPGLIFGLLIMSWGLWKIGWRAPLTIDGRAGALALATIMLTVGLLSFGIWQSWWISVLWLSSAFYAANLNASTLPSNAPST